MKDDLIVDVAKVADDVDMNLLICVLLGSSWLRMFIYFGVVEGKTGHEWYKFVVDGVAVK